MTRCAHVSCSLAVLPLVASRSGPGLRRQAGPKVASGEAASVRVYVTAKDTGDRLEPNGACGLRPAAAAR